MKTIYNQQDKFVTIVEEENYVTYVSAYNKALYDLQLHVLDQSPVDWDFFEKLKAKIEEIELKLP